MDKLRLQHIKKFKRLPPEERLRWALETGYSIQANLPEKAKKIKEFYRNGGKKLISGRLG